MSTDTERFLAHARIEVPLLCGAMYPCSNPALVAAVSEAGAMGIIQPIVLTFVHHLDFREGLRQIKGLTTKPVGMNVIVEKSSKVYEDRMKLWVDIALEEGIRFFVTSLGDPKWVVDKVHAVGGFVYHDVVSRRFAIKALESGADGLIAVNERAGGHAGTKTPMALLQELQDLKVPVLCAGGVGKPTEFAAAIASGYAGVQMGTRFIASAECSAHDDYKQAIVKAGPDDIVLTDKITGVPVAVIATPYIRQMGLKAGPLARRLLTGRKTKHWVRLFYTLRSAFQLREASLRGQSYRDYWQAGKSVEGVTMIEPAGRIVRHFAEALNADSQEVLS